MKPRSAKNDQPDSVRGGSLFSKGRVDLGSTLGNSTHVTIPSIAREDPSDTLISTRAPPTPLSPCQDMSSRCSPKPTAASSYEATPEPNWSLTLCRAAPDSDARSRCNKASLKSTL